MIPVYIKIERFGLKRYSLGFTQGYLMKVIVTEAVNVDKEILVFQRFPPANDVFRNIASPADLQEYPIGSPIDNIPFFRLSEVRLVFRNITLADDAWTKIKAEVSSLVDTLSSFSDLSLVEIVEFGTAPLSSSSSTSSHSSRPSSSSSVAPLSSSPSP